MIALFFLACSGTPEKTADDTARTLDSASVTDTTDTEPSTPIDTATAAELEGTLPDTPLPPPSFVATNHDGQARDQSHLIGQPTVIWFYPAAGTYG